MNINFMKSLGFSSPDDPRVSWLQNIILQYFENWFNSIQESPNLTPNAHQKLFI